MTTTQPIIAFIAIGANLGFAEDSVRNALADLARLPKTEFIAASGLYQSPSMGAEGPDYINAVAQIETHLSAEDLLYTLLNIERQHGRVRSPDIPPNAPRTLDLDLLIYGDAILHTPTLTVPHPRIHERAFVLRPLLELVDDWTIPGQGSARALLDGVAHQSITRIEN